MPWHLPGHLFLCADIFAEVTVLKDMIICPVKINLTLRVLSKREDGYHEIISLFWKKKGIEGLTIQPHDNENIGDILDTQGMEIAGENILVRTLRWARARCPGIPPLKMLLKKEFPAGSGIGAGSGNAAALLQWLECRYMLDTSKGPYSEIGADVPFLAGKDDIAIVAGIGEKIAPAGQIEGLKWILGFPEWNSDTAAAYAELDRSGKGAEILRPEECIGEALTISEKLKSKKAAGLLPNDFLQVVAAKHPEYLIAFDIAENSGALAWGLSGSGSALFMVFSENIALRSAKRALDRQEWIIKTTELE